LKGPTRPINALADRALLLAALSAVSYVVAFSDDTPRALIESIVPDVLVKGGDYEPEQIVGADVVRAAGGCVQVLPFVPGQSTSGVIARATGAKP
jgi:D-beta-D-heptose 7-phosphate kinase/D-beta-D-heptose 1-phosphate adenosyltransferase